MLLHMEDGEVLNIIVSDKGIALIVCPQCKRIWSGNLSSVIVNQEGTHTISAISPGIAEIIHSTMNTNPSILERIGLTPDVISNLGL